MRYGLDGSHLNMCSVTWVRLPSSGLDGSRTRVQKTIPDPSTSVVNLLTFPPPYGGARPYGFSSFMIRPQLQSLDCVVSCVDDTPGPKRRCLGGAVA